MSYVHEFLMRPDAGNILCLWIFVVSMLITFGFWLFTLENGEGLDAANPHDKDDDSSDGSNTPC